MKSVLLIAFLLTTLITVKAQDGAVKELKGESEKTIKKDEKDTIPQIWKKGGLINLNINQGSLSNWAAGGDKFSFSLNAYVNLYGFYKKNKHSWDNSLDLAYGIVSTTSLGNRKASDRIDFLSKYGYSLTKKLNLAGLFNFRSQFANGYAYSKNSAGADVSSLTSKMFAPAYVLVSIGLDYKPTDNFSVFFSPATARWIIVTDNLLGKFYGVEPGKKSRQEFGAFVSANYMKKFGETFTYKSRLDLFSNYKSKPQNVDIFWSNVLAAKITKYINFTFNLDFIYDDNIANVNSAKGPAPQILQLMGIGFAYNFKK